MSFKKYVKEQEDLVIVNQEKSKKQKVADLIRTMEELNNEKFRDFAVNELGLEDAEAETIVYKMLRDFLLAGEANANVPAPMDTAPVDMDMGADMDMDMDADMDADMDTDMDDMEDDMEDMDDDMEDDI